MNNESSTLSLKFVLKNINPSQLDKEYILKDLQEVGIEQMSNHIVHQHVDKSAKITTILENVGMAKSKSKPFDTIVMNDVSIRLFVSPTISTYQTKDINESFIDIKTLRKSCCWNCRHTIPFEWHPLGIPLKYRAAEDAFEVEGVYCSFNCIMAYLQEHTEYRYKDSSVLLGMMYRKIFNVMKRVTEICPAPSWKLLRDYGGHLSIDEYRKCFQTTEYKCMQQLIRKDKFRLLPAAELFVEV